MLFILKKLSMKKLEDRKKYQSKRKQELLDTDNIDLEFLMLPIYINSFSIASASFFAPIPFSATGPTQAGQPFSQAHP